VRERLLAGTYQPQTVRRVSIPKPQGGERLLGIPTVQDRLIQQALHQVLSPVFEPTFSDSSYGFRPGRSAHQAVLAMQAHVNEGHRFCRYADDCNIYVASEQAGHRVMNSVTRFLERRLKLTVNLEKSAVDRPWKRSFLGYSLTWHKQARLRIAQKSQQRLQDKLRQLLRKSRGRALWRTIAQLAPVLRGWAAYYKLSQGRRPLETLDGWVRRKLRLVLWRQWKRVVTRARNLMRLGLAEVRAWTSATNGRGPWWNSGASHMNAALPKRVFNGWGLISLLDTALRLQSRP